MLSDEMSAIVPPPQKKNWQELARRKRTHWKNLELSGLFFSGLPAAANKADMYRLVSCLAGHKQVFFSYLTSSALVVLDSREDALQFQATAAESVSQALGPAVNVQLVAEGGGLGPEVPQVPGEEAASRGVGANAGWISEAANCRALVQSLLSAQVPVVVDFHQYRKVGQRD